MFFFARASHFQRQIWTSLFLMLMGLMPVQAAVTIELIQGTWQSENYAMPVSKYAWGQAEGIGFLRLEINRDRLTATQRCLFSSLDGKGRRVEKSVDVYGSSRVDVGPLDTLVLRSEIVESDRVKAFGGVYECALQMLKGSKLDFELTQFQDANGAWRAGLLDKGEAVPLRYLKVEN